MYCIGRILRMCAYSSILMSGEPFSNLQRPLRRLGAVRPARAGSFPGAYRKQGKGSRGRREEGG